MPANNNSRQIRQNPQMRNAANRNKRRRRNNALGLIVSVVLLAVIAVVGSMIFIYKYAPTKEEMALDEYYTYFSDEDAALIVNDEYEQMNESDTAGDAVVLNGKLYFEWSALKSRIDSRYVFDNTEEIMRYVTDVSVISVPYGGTSYSVDKNFENFEDTIVVGKYNTYFVAADFVKKYSDFEYKIYENPYRAVVYKSGYKRDVATLKTDISIRRLGGPKSKIVKNAKKGEEVTVLDDAGKWRKVATEDGVIGYTQSTFIKNSTQKKQKATLEARNYKHNLMNSEICLGWHQVTNQASNSTIDDVIANTTSMNVISPTWYYLDDNEGGIADFSSTEYVNKAHSKGLKVWGLISNLENTEVDTKTVLSRTSYRDALIGNLVGSAIACGMDGINVDMEGLSANTADGYIEFIRELSLRCEKNDLVLSVDNYVPSNYTKFYNRSEQAKYADYVIIMAYDEHNRGDNEPGSVASKDFVENGIEATLDEVPAEQVVLGMPFYGRTWSVDNSGEVSSEVLYMKDVSTYLQEHNATAEWDEDLGQNYAEFSENGNTYMVWPEDAKSLAIKLSMIDDYDLAGGAFWKLTFEPSTVWSVIDSYID